MNKTKKILILLLVSALFCPLLLRAQDNYVAPPLEQIRKPYKLSDNLFYGYSIGASYSLSSFVTDQMPLKMLRPTIDFYFGKTFTKFFSAQATLGYHSQASSISEKALETMYAYSGDEELIENGPNYTLHMASLRLDGIFCLNRLFGNRNQDAKVKINGIAGVGLNYVFAYSGKTENWEGYIQFDRSMKIAPEFHAGMQLTFHGTEKTDFTIQGTWHQSTSDYTGLCLVKGPRHYVELTFGLTKRILNRYSSYKFENFKGNEKYYFEIEEQRMLDTFTKGKKAKAYNLSSIQQHDLENETILSFPHTYPYLTVLQTSKLKKMVQTLRQHPNYVAVIDIYPYVSLSDAMSYGQSVDRCKEEINTEITTLWGNDSQPRVRYVEHKNDNSPVNPDGIWFHNAFISYEEAK